MRVLSSSPSRSSKRIRSLPRRSGRVTPWRVAAVLGLRLCLVRLGKRRLDCRFPPCGQAGRSRGGRDTAFRGSRYSILGSAPPQRGRGWRCERLFVPAKSARYRILGSTGLRDSGDLPGYDAMGSALIGRGSAALHHDVDRPVSEPAPLAAGFAAKPTSDSEHATVSRPANPRPGSGR